MNKECHSDQNLKDIRDAILEIRDIQKEKLECAKKTLQLLETKSGLKEKSTVKKKKSMRVALEERVHTKLKEIDQIKLDLTGYLKRSHSTKKKHNQSQSVNRSLR